MLLKSLLERPSSEVWVPSYYSFNSACCLAHPLGGSSNVCSSTWVPATCMGDLYVVPGSWLLLWPSLRYAGFGEWTSWWKTPSLPALWGDGQSAKGTVVRRSKAITCNTSNLPELQVDPRLLQLQSSSLLMSPGSKQETGQMSGLFPPMWETWMKFYVSNFRGWTNTWKHSLFFPTLPFKVSKS